MKSLVTLLVIFIFSCTIYSQVYQNISVHDAQALIQDRQDKPMFTILDVRTRSEYTNDHLASAAMRNFYDTDFATQLDSLDKSRAYLIYCQSGNRSGQAFSIMQSLGFKEVYNMLGGISSWRSNGYPTTTVVPEFVNIYIPQLRIDPNSLELLAQDDTASEFILTGDFRNYSVQLKDYSNNVLQDYSSTIHPVTFDITNPTGLYQLVITHENQVGLSLAYLLE